MKQAVFNLKKQKIIEVCATKDKMTGNLGKTHIKKKVFF